MIPTSAPIIDGNESEIREELVRYIPGEETLDSKLIGFVRVVEGRSPNRVYTKGRIYEGGLITPRGNFIGLAEDDFFIAPFEEDSNLTYLDPNELDQLTEDNRYFN